MRSLITGGAGFIGSHVARQCLELGHQVVVLDDLSGGFRDQVPEGAQFVRGSVVDHDLLNELFDTYRFDYVYHLAAYAAEGLSHFIRRFNYTNNLIGSANVINAAVLYEARCLVFTSSIAVYGSACLPMREETKPSPEDPYGVAKYAVELDLEAAARIYGLPYVIFRPHNVYGEHQNIGDRYRNVIGIFMNQIMQGRPMSIFGNGFQTRAFTYIDDVAPIIARSAQTPEAYGEVFNVGADTPYTLNCLAETVAHAFDRSPEIVHLPPRQEVAHAYCDHSKARRVFSLNGTVDLNTGVERMAEWAKRVGPRQSQRFEKVEVQKNMPAVWAS